MRKRSTTKGGTPTSALVLATAVLIVLGSAAAWWHSTTPVAAAAPARHASGLLLLPPAAPAGQMVLYGHITSLSRKRGRIELGFDPAWFTSGATASAAKRADTGSGDVPNDNYVVEEGHRVLTYLVPGTARVTVLTNQGTMGIAATAISVAELLRIVNGGRHRTLFEPLDSGVWIRVRIDAVRELDQQYRP
jgi:hypothetical protein